LLRQTRSVCAREQRDEAIHPSVMPHDGLLRFALRHKRYAFVADNDEAGSFAQ
jgi:hypothetical protein